MPMNVNIRGRENITIDIEDGTSPSVTVCELAELVGNTMYLLSMNIVYDEDYDSISPVTGKPIKSLDDVMISIIYDVFTMACRAYTDLAMHDPDADDNISNTFRTNGCQ